MDSTVFLARLLGPVFLAFGAFVVLYPKRVTAMGREVLASEALLLFSGALALPAGLAIVLTHNHWVWGWPVLVTVLGWIMVGAGTARILLPGPLKRMGMTMLDRRGPIAAAGGVMFLIGAVLAWQGYLAAG